MKGKEIPQGGVEEGVLEKCVFIIAGKALKIFGRHQPTNVLNW